MKNANRSGTPQLSQFIRDFRSPIIGSRKPTQYRGPTDRFLNFKSLMLWKINQPHTKLHTLEEIEFALRLNADTMIGQLLQKRPNCLKFNAYLATARNSFLRIVVFEKKKRNTT